MRKEGVSCCKENIYNTQDHKDTVDAGSCSYKDTTEKRTSQNLKHPMQTGHKNFSLGFKTCEADNGEADLISASTKNEQVGREDCKYH